MTKIKTIACGAAAVALMSANSAQAACFIWEHYDGRGKGLTVADNTSVNFNNSLPGRYHPQFANAVSSIATNNGCTASLYLGGNQGHVNFSGSRVNLTGSQNDASLGLKCSC